MAGQRKSETAGIGTFKMQMEWQQASYDNVSGNGMGEYSFFFDDGVGMPERFPKEMQNLISRIRVSTPSNNKVWFAVGQHFNESVFNIAKQESHRCGYAYCPEAFRGNEDQAPFMFGEKDNGEYITISKKKIVLEPEEFSSGNIAKLLLDRVVKLLGAPADEHEKAVVDIEFENIGYGICLIKTPDRGYVVGTVSATHDPFYAFTMFDGNDDSSIEGLVELIIEPTVNEIAKLLKEIKS